jgi:hypothetical protein
MQLVLTEVDLAKMPSDLRRDLLQFLGGTSGAPVGAEPGTTALSQTQATALLREVSFHRDGKALRSLIRPLAYRDDAEPPARQLLIDTLPEEARAAVGRHLATLNRLTARVLKRRDAKLWRHRRADDAYAVHPVTRKALRDLLPVLARSGKSEEPLWEG